MYFKENICKVKLEKTPINEVFAELFSKSEENKPSFFQKAKKTNLAFSKNENSLPVLLSNAEFRENVADYLLADASSVKL